MLISNASVTNFFKLRIYNIWYRGFNAIVRHTHSNKNELDEMKFISLHCTANESSKW